MKKGIFVILTIVLAFSVVTCRKLAVDDTRLKFIPAEATCYVQFPNPGELITKAGSLINTLNIPDMPPINPVLMLFSRVLGVPLTGVEDLGNYGLDANQDAAILWLEPDFKNEIVTIHIKDRSLVEDLLTHRIGELVETEYNGVKYLRGNESAVIFLDDLMLYAQKEDDGKRCIDAYMGKQPSISASNLSLAEDGDITGFISLEKLALTYGSRMRGGLDNLIPEMKDER